jgi:hypothetical protein
MPAKLDISKIIQKAKVGLLDLLSRRQIFVQLIPSLGLLPMHFITAVPRENLRL